MSRGGAADETASGEGPQLARGIGRFDVAALVINVVIGAGILGLPGRVYGLIGGWSLLALAGVALLIAAFALVLAELASRFDRTGGPYLYVAAAFGPVPGFLIGWLLWVSRLLIAPTQLNLLLEYLAGPFPMLGEGLGRVLAITGVVGAYTALTLSGVSVSARASTAITALKLTLFAAFVAAGLAYLDPGRFALSAAPPPADLSDAVLLLVFAFVGFESIPIVAGEARDARRNMPAGLLAGMIVVTLVYAAVLAVTVSVLPDPATPERAVAVAAEAMGGTLGSMAATAGVVVVLLGAMTGGFLLTPRLLYALAERGQLPAVFARVHPRTRTPHIAILASSAAVLLITIFNSFLTVLVLASAVRLVTYVVCCLALLRLRRPDAPPATLLIPGGRVLAVVGAVLAAIVLIVSAREQLLVTAVAAVVGLLLLYVARRRSS